MKVSSNLIAKANKLAQKPSFWLVISLVLLVLGGLLIYKYVGINTLFPSSAGTQSAETEEVAKLTAKIGKLILLPANETPTLATVADKDKLSGQQFFANAENGDKVLIYQTARKAFLYRPSENRVIEVGPVNIAPSTATPSAQITTGEMSYKFVLLNGTNVVGLTRRYEPVLAEAVPEMEVVDRDNARGNYEKSLIIDLVGGRQDLTQNIAEKLNLTVSELPKAESKPEEGDYLIILGSDQTEDQN